MKKLMKMIRRMTILTGLIFMLSLTACGENEPLTVDSQSTESLSNEVELGDFKFTVPEQFKPEAGEESDDTTRCFSGDNGETALVIKYDTCNHSSREARIDFICEIIAPEYNTTSKRIKREKLAEDRYYLYWTDRVNGEELCCGAYLCYAEDCELMIYETDTPVSAEELRTELVSIGETAVYTGTPSVKKDSYTIATADFRVHIGSNYDSPQLQEASEDPSGIYMVNSDSIQVYYKEADIYYRGDSFFMISLLEDQTTDIAELAKDRAEPKETEGSLKSERVLEESTFGKIWPELKDDGLKSAKIYKLDIKIEDNEYLIEMYFFAFNGKNYSVGLSYVEGDETARKDFLDQFYQVEFVTR